MGIVGTGQFRHDRRDVYDPGVLTFLQMGNRFPAKAHDRHEIHIEGRVPIFVRERRERARRREPAHIIHENIQLSPFPDHLGDHSFRGALFFQVCGDNDVFDPMSLEPSGRFMQLFGFSRADANFRSGLPEGHRGIESESFAAARDECDPTVQRKVHIQNLVLTPSAGGFFKSSLARMKKSICS